jgi:hypothetical protein
VYHSILGIRDVFKDLFESNKEEEEATRAYTGYSSSTPIPHMPPLCGAPRATAEAVRQTQGQMVETLLGAVQSGIGPDHERPALEHVADVGYKVDGVYKSGTGGLPRAGGPQVADVLLGRAKKSIHVTAASPGAAI